MERIRQAVEQARRDREKTNIGDQSKFGSAAETAAEVHVGRDALSDEPANYLKAKSVVVGPRILDQNRLVAAIDGHPLQDSYRMLRTRVLQEMKSNDWKTIAVASPTPDVGKTLTAVNLAIMIGRDPSYTALLIDADLRNPSVHRSFNYEPEFGINDYLFNGQPLGRVLFRPDMQGLTVLPGREPIRESSETLASPKFTGMLEEVRSRYANRIIVVDLAPILAVDDALALKMHIDCLLMVVESGETKRDEFVRAIELIEPLPVLGTVLNKAAKKPASQY